MHIFFSVGEPSGDLHAANLMRELKARRRDLKFSGIGGPKMQAEGCRLLRDMSDLAIVGFWPVLCHLFEFLGLLSAIDRYLAQHRPSAVVMIDYPGFNSWVAWRAKAHGIPVFYYGLPQYWGWAPWRVNGLKENVDHALCKLPFEEKWYRERGLNATYVGHPYFDELQAQRLDADFLAAERAKPGRRVTILPGSRNHEVESNLPAFLQAAEKIAARVPGVRFAIASYNERQAYLARRMCQGLAFPVEVHVDRTPELIHLGDACLACSGSVSLELVYHVRPSVILYQVSWLTFHIFSALATVRYITLGNLLTADDIGRTDGRVYDRRAPEHANVLFPEYPTYDDKSTELAEHVVEWLTDEPARQALLGRIAALRARLCHTGASATAAEYILRHLPAATLPLPRPRAPAAARAAG